MRKNHSCQCVCALYTNKQKDYIPVCFVLVLDLKKYKFLENPHKRNNKICNVSYVFISYYIYTRIKF